MSGPSILAALFEVLDQHRSAILSRDVAAVRQLNETLAGLLGNLAALIAALPAPGSRLPALGPNQSCPANHEPRATSHELRAGAERLREQVELNQRLIENGLAAADEWVECLVHSLPRSLAPSQTDAVLLTGVA